MSKKIRKRLFFVQKSYLYDIQDENGNINNEITEEEWKKKILSEWTLEKLEAKTIAIIFHDKDRLEDGEKKGLHVHGIVDFKNARYQEGVITLMKLTSEYNCQFVKSRCEAFRYLTHISESAINEKKYRYRDDEVYIFDEKNRKYEDFVVRSEDKKEKKKDKEELEMMLESMVEDIFDGNKIPVECENELLANDKIKKIDILRSRKILQDALDMRFAHLLDLHKQGKFERDLKLFYVYGSAGTGKTTLCKKLAMKFAKRYYLVAQKTGNVTLDILANYSGEDAVFFDEVIPSIFTSTSNFLQMFNPFDSTEFASRYYNKFFISNFGFLANSLEFSKFVYNLYDLDKSDVKNKDNIFQIVRRFSCIIKLENNIAEVNFMEKKLKYHDSSILNAFDLSKNAFEKNIKETYKFEYDKNDINSLDYIIEEIYRYFA